MDANLLVPIIVAIIASIPGMYALFIGRNKTGIDASASAATALRSYSEEVVKLRAELATEREEREKLRRERDAQMQAIEQQYKAQLQAAEQKNKAQLEETEAKFQAEIDELKRRLDLSEERGHYVEQQLIDATNVAWKLYYQLKSKDIVPEVRPVLQPGKAQG